MKRWPLVASFVLFIALCASLAYWAMQFFKPPVRPVAAPPASVQAPPNIDAAATLFGGKGNTALASNFQLKGVIMAGNAADSVAIIAADGKPAQAVRANAEVLPGVKITEVNRSYVLLMDNGVEKRVELPEDAKLASGIGSAAPVATTSLPSRPAPAMPATVVDDANDSASPASVTSTPSAPAPPPASTQQPAAASAGATPAPPQAPAASPLPRSGMGSPPITNQGSMAGSAANPPPAAPATPGMPVTPPPRQ
jgi:general secretion pathway protein C